MQSIVTFWKCWFKKSLFPGRGFPGRVGQKEQKEVRALHEKRRTGRDFPERGVINHHKLCSAKPESSSPTAACRPGGGPGLISRLVPGSGLGGCAGGSILHGIGCANGFRAL